MQAYVDAVLDLSSHFITRLRRYASFCRTLASHAVGATAGSGSNRNMVTSPTHSSASPSTPQGQHLPLSTPYVHELVFSTQDIIARTVTSGSNFL